MTTAQALQVFQDLAKSSLDTTFLPATEIYRYLTMAQREIMTKMVEHHQGWFEATDSITIVSGTDPQEYDLASDMFMGKIVTVEYKKASGDEYRPMRQIDKQDRLSATSALAFSGTVLVTYIQRLSDIDASTNPSIPADFHDLMVLKAVIYAVGGKDEDDIQNLLFMEKRIESNLFRTLIDRVINEPTFIKYTDEEDVHNEYNVGQPDFYITGTKIGFSN